MPGQLKSIGIWVCLTLMALTDMASAEPLKIRVSWSNTPAHLAPLLYQNKQILKHWGKSYIVETIRLRGSGANIIALAADEIDIAAMNYQSIVNTIVRARLDIRVIADVLQLRDGYADVEYMADPRKIKSLGDLKGKRFGITSRGSGFDTGIQVKLLQIGLKDKRDYSLVEMRPAAMLPSLEAGKIDVAALLPPFSPIAADKGYVTLFKLGDTFGETQTVSWIARNSWLEENEAALKDFFEDTVRAVQWITDPANRAEALKITSRVTKRPAAQYESWMFTEKDVYHDPNLRPHVANLQRNINDAFKYGLIPEAVRIENYLDLSFVDEAEHRLKRNTEE